MQEARLKQTEVGVVAESEGWFVLNVREMGFETMPGGGAWAAWEPEGVAQQYLSSTPWRRSTGPPSASPLTPRAMPTRTSTARPRPCGRRGRLIRPPGRGPPAGA
jgi:hypothetical protein